jgi:hypothetical protein
MTGDSPEKRTIPINQRRLLIRMFPCLSPRGGSVNQCRLRIPCLPAYRVLSAGNFLAASEPSAEPRGPPWFSRSARSITSNSTTTRAAIGRPTYVWRLWLSSPVAEQGAGKRGRLKQRPFPKLPPGHGLELSRRLRYPLNWVCT